MQAGVISTSHGGRKAFDSYRHSLPVRLWHWTFACAAVGLLFTGICVLNVHPRLYWGEVGNESLPAVVAIEAAGSPIASGPAPAVLVLGTHRFNVTGIFGVPLDAGADGTYFLIYPMPESWHFGGLRAWHFALAWILVLGWLLYVSYIVLRGRLHSMLLPSADQLTAAAIRHDLLDHLRFRRAVGKEALRYGLLQKVAYLLVIGLLVPLLVLTGLTMSNAITIRFPELFGLFGGRESARTLHALAASLMLVFIVIHLVQLAVIGPLNAIRTMTTGYYRVFENSHD